MRADQDHSEEVQERYVRLRCGSALTMRQRYRKYVGKARFLFSNRLSIVACRYEKGTWSGCVNQMMTRIDNLKANSDTSCEKTRRLTKRCKPEANTKKSTKGDYHLFDRSANSLYMRKRRNNLLPLFSRRTIEQEIRQAVIVRQSPQLPPLIGQRKRTLISSILILSILYSIADRLRGRVSMAAIASREQVVCTYCLGIMRFGCSDA